MNKKTVLIISIILLSSLIPLMGGYAEESVWIQEERGADYELRYDITNSNATHKLYSTTIGLPLWIYDDSEFVPFIYEDNYTSDGFYQVQNGMIGVRIFDYYAEFYTPDMSEIRLYEETWELQQFTNKWGDIGVQSGSPTFQISQNERSINISKIFNCWAGEFTINYIFMEGSPLKHTITFISSIADPTQFRVLQKWAGIVATKVKHEAGEDVITSAMTVNGSQFSFLKEDGTISIFENQRAMYYGLNETDGSYYVLENENLKPVEIDVHAQGLKCDFTFGNWTLEQDETLEVDPDSSTTRYTTDDSYVRQGFPNENYGSIGYMSVSHDSDPDERRALLKFDTSNIQSSATVTSAELHIAYFSYKPGFDVDCYSVTNDGWAESTVKWSNMPSPVTYQDTITVSVQEEYVWVEFDVINFVPSQVSGDDIVSLCLKSPVSAADTYSYFYPKESQRDPHLYIEYYVTPTITSAEITDMDEDDNVYGMRKYYNFKATVYDYDYAMDIEKVYLQIKNGAAVLAEFRATTLTGTPTWAIQSGSALFDLNTGTSSWVESGRTGYAYFKIRAKSDITQYNDLELAVYVEDEQGESSGFTVMQTDYFDIITRLVSTGFVATDDDINMGGTGTLTGTIRYSTTTSGNTPSSISPPNDQFTAVRIHDSAHTVKGSDTTIVSGAFSVSFAIPSAVQSNSYHIYLDMVPDWTDGDAVDGDTVAIIGNRINFKTATLETTDNHINSDATGEWYAELQYEYQGTEVTDGSVILNTGSMSFDSGADHRWEYTNAPGSVVDVVRNIASVSGNSKGITLLNSAVTSDSETIEFDEVVFQSDTLEITDERVNFDGNGEWHGKFMLDNNDEVITSGTINLNTGTMSYDGGQTRWEHLYSLGAVGSVSRNVVSVSGITGGITKINSAVTGDSESIFFDGIETVSVTFDDNRVNIGTSVEVRYVLRYGYDSVSFTGSDGSIVGYSWDGTNSWWDKAVNAPSSPGADNYDENDLGAITDNNYDITSKVDVAGANLIGDKYNVTDFWASHYNPHVGDNITLYAIFESEYDSHICDGDDAITIEDIQFTFDPFEDWFCAEITETSKGLYHYDTLDSIWEDTYGIDISDFGFDLEINWVEYTVKLHGPFYENGTSSGNTTIFVHFAETFESFLLEGETEKSYLTVPLMFRWDLEDGGSRVIYTISNNETYHIFEPFSDYGGYLFTILDHSNVIGFQSSFLEALEVVNGTRRLIERKLIWDTVNPTTLVLQKDATYEIQIRTLTGYTYNYGYFTPAVDTSRVLQINEVEWGDQIHQVGADLIIEAHRPADNHIRVNYKDETERTESIFIEICLMNNTQVWNTTSTEQMIQFNWYEAVNVTDYMVKMTIEHELYGTCEYTTFIPQCKPDIPDFPDFDILGSGLKVAFGVFLIIMPLYVFSRSHMLYGVFCSNIMAYIVTYLGIAPIPYSIIHVVMGFTIIWGLWLGDKQ